MNGLSLVTARYHYGNGDFYDLEGGIGRNVGGGQFPGGNFQDGQIIEIGLNETGYVGYYEILKSANYSEANMDWIGAPRLGITGYYDHESGKYLKVSEGWQTMEGFGTEKGYLGGKWDYTSTPRNELFNWFWEYDHDAQAPSPQDPAPLPPPVLTLPTGNENPLAPAPQPTPEPTPEERSPWEPGGQDEIVGMNKIIGSNNKDRLKGTNGADEILGYGGNDVINGKGGDDLIDSGSWTIGKFDKVKGGSGSDTFVVKDGYWAFIKDFNVIEDKRDVSGLSEGFNWDNIGKKTYIYGDDGYEVARFKGSVDLSRANLI